LSAERQLKIALKLTGVSFETGLEETFYFSNSGFTASIAGDTEEIYYEPLIKSSILIKRQVGTTDDHISIQLINDQQNHLSEYLYNGYKLELYLSANYAPSSSNWYPVFLGVSESVIVKRLTVEIKAKSHFDIFNKSINPEVFSGIRGEYEGDDVLKGKTKPRVFGKVFNISPILLRSDNLVYGCNWSYDGTRDSILSFDGIRDGGAQLILDQSDFAGGDYPTTQSMDLYAPPAGQYVMCTAESTFKLGSSPVYGVTLDITQATQTITDFVQFFVQELAIGGFIIHSAPSYTFGLYIDSLSSYFSLFDSVIKDLDIAYWFDASSDFNVASLRNYEDNPELARFIDAGQDFLNDQDIVTFAIERTKYILPPKQVQLGYRQNYTVQSQDQLAGLTTEEEKQAYKEPYRYSSNTLQCNSDLYKNLESIDYNTAIYDQYDAELAASEWLKVRRQINDVIEVTCPILSSNSGVILGVIIDPSSAFVNIASTSVLISSTTYLISHNNSAYSGQKNLELGDTVLVNSFYFNHVDQKFVVHGIYTDLKKMQVKYTLIGLRAITTCRNNVIDGVDNVVDASDNIIDDF